MDLKYTKKWVKMDKNEKLWAKYTKKVQNLPKMDELKMDKMNLNGQN